jgi:hypothetical protein
MKLPLLRTDPRTKRESPVIPHSVPLGMGRLLEEARTALGVRFPGDLSLD